MQPTTDVSSVGEAAGNKRKAVAGDPNDPATSPTNQLSRCAACGDLFRPLRAWHTACNQCYVGSRLYRAIQAYREVRQ